MSVTDTYSLIQIYTGQAALLKIAGVDADDIVGSGPVIVRHETNDNNDDGYVDAETEVWYTRHATLEKAIKVHGYTRTGLFGQPVDVLLNDEPLLRPVS